MRSGARTAFPSLSLSRARSETPRARNSLFILLHKTQTLCTNPHNHTHTLSPPRHLQCHMKGFHPRDPRIYTRLRPRFPRRCPQTARAPPQRLPTWVSDCYPHSTHQTIRHAHQSRRDTPTARHPNDHVVSLIPQAHQLETRPHSLTFTPSEITMRSEESAYRPPP